MNEFQYLTKQTANENAKETAIDLINRYKRALDHLESFPDTSRQWFPIPKEQFVILEATTINTMDDLIKVIGQHALKNFRCEISGKTYPEISTLYAVNGVGDFPFAICREVIKEWISD